MDLNELEKACHIANAKWWQDPKTGYDLRTLRYDYENRDAFPKPIPCWNTSRGGAMTPNGTPRNHADEIANARACTEPDRAGRIAASIIQ